MRASKSLLSGLAPTFVTGARFGFDALYPQSRDAIKGNARAISITKEGRGQDSSLPTIKENNRASFGCPAVIEQLAFPDDFVWPGGKIPKDVERSVEKRGEGPIALMDGGIYDNQGIESLLLADERRDTDLDMFIISDVDQPSGDLYPFPEEGDRRRNDGRDAQSRRAGAHDRLRGDCRDSRRGGFGRP